MKTDHAFYSSLQNTEITWMVSNRNGRSFDVIFEGEHVRLHLDDFPDDPTVFTEFFRGQIVDVEESPQKWHLQN